MKKKILLISGTFYPKNSPRSFRTTELAKEFSKLGHDVTIYIPNKNEIHEQFEIEFNVKIESLGESKFKDIDISKGNKYFKLFKRVIKRSLLQLFEYPDIGLTQQVKKALINTNKKYDLLISIAAPHTIHWGVALVGKKLNKIASTWIADCGDPFMGSTTDTFKKVFYFKYVEKFWCRKVDYISVPFKGAVDGYYDEFRTKIKIIPQGFNFDKINEIQNNNLRNEVPTFAYAGLLIPGSRDPRPLIEFVISLKINFKFILYTQSRGLLSEYIRKNQNNIEIRNYIPREELLTELSKMDFLVNFDNKVSTQLPSKLIDYYLIGKPVLSINSFNFDQEVIKQFLKKNYSNKFIFDNPDQYRIENVSKQFLELL